MSYVQDGAKHRYEGEIPGDDAPLDIALGPGQAVMTTRRFAVPSGAPDLHVLITREGDIAFPRCCIIGEGFLHKRALIPVEREAP